MTGSRRIPPDPASVRLLLAASRHLGGAHGLLLELCVLTLGLPWEVLAIELEAIDRARLVVPVPARGGRERLLHLPPAAMVAIDRRVDLRGRAGQAVTGGRGPRLVAETVRLDRLRARLADADPSTADVAWDFHRLRRAGLEALLDRGVDRDDLLRLLGQDRRSRRSEHDHLPEVVARRRERAAAAIASWEDLLSEDEEVEGS